MDHRRVHDSVGMLELLDDLLPRSRPLLRGSGGGAGGDGDRAHHPFVVGAVRLLESLPGGAVFLGRPGGGGPRSVAVQGAGRSVALGVHLFGASCEPRLPAPRLRLAPRRRAPAPVVGHVLVPVEAHRRDGPLLAGLRHVRARVWKRAGHSLGARLRGGGRCGVPGGVPASRSAAPVVCLPGSLPAAFGLAAAPVDARPRWRRAGEFLRLGRLHLRPHRHHGGAEQLDVPIRVQRRVAVRHREGRAPWWPSPSWWPRPSFSPRSS